MSSTVRIWLDGSRRVARLDMGCGLCLFYLGAFLIGWAEDRALRVAQECGGPVGAALGRVAEEVAGE